MAPFTTLELGGPARGMAVARTEAELGAALAWARREGWRVLLLGGGSNLVIGDDGFDGLVIRVGLRGRSVCSNGEVLAAAGEVWDGLVADTVQAGFAGFECLSGIPGSVGATPIQNVGAYGREIAELVTEVRVMSRATGAVSTLGPEQCGFGYRDSDFKRDPASFAILSVRYRLEPGSPAIVRYPELEAALRAGKKAPPWAPGDVREAVLAVRRQKSMVLDPEDPNRRSVGSFFTNPVVPKARADAVVATALAAGLVQDPSEVPRYPAGPDDVKLSAAWLIERSGIPKGYRSGSVGISSRHTLALVHHGGGSTRALLALAGEVRDAVVARFGVELRPEPTLVGCALPERSAAAARKPKS